MENPQEIVKVGDEIEVKILRVDIDERKIGLSLKRAQWAAEGEAPAGGPVRRRGGLGAETGMLGSLNEDLLLTTKQPSAEGEEPPAPKEQEEPKKEEDAQP